MCMNGDSRLRAAARATAYATTGLPFLGALPSRAACEASHPTVVMHMPKLEAGGKFYAAVARAEFNTVKYLCTQTMLCCWQNLLFFAAWRCST